MPGAQSQIFSEGPRRQPGVLDQFGRPVAYSGYYPGLGSSRERRTMPVIIGDSDKTSHTSYNRLQAAGIATQFYATQGFFRGPVRDLATYAVGPGLKPQSQVEDDKTARAIEDYFNFWGENYADAAGKHTFDDLQFLASIAIDVVGDIGFNMFSPSERSIGQLQVVEGHRIAGSEDGYRDGVKLDRMGRRVKYRVSEAPIGEDSIYGEENFREIDAGHFIFLHDPDRADATRGISSMAHALANSRDIVDTLLYTKVQVKMDSALGWVIKTMNGGADPGTSYIENGYKAAQTGGLPWETWQAGMVPRLKVGEDVVAPTSNRPSPAFMGFLEFLIRDLAVGLGLPFEFVWDLVKAKGAGSRFILAKAQRRFAQRRRLLENRFLTRVFRWVIGKAIARKELPAVPYWWLVRWQGPAEITVDLGREAQANRDDLKYGNRTLLIDAGEQGLHWKDDIREQQTVEVNDKLDRAISLVERAKGKGHELTLDKALFMYSADSPNSPQLPVKGEDSPQRTQRGAEEDE